MKYFLLILLLCSNLKASTLMVEKKVFTTFQYKTFFGKIIPVVKIGWESYGKLNAAKDNVILITHSFTGNSHAAGKYDISDAKAGYWDEIIGPGKAIDTNKYFVLSSDSLVNANAYLDHVVTTGPSSINPDTGKKYNLDFPILTIRDFVNVQKRLLESLGIKKLHGVMGASMGSHQALEWASAYPDMVERVITVTGLGETSTYGRAILEHWIRPIKLDPNWKNGEYDDPLSGPLVGVKHSLKNIYLSAQQEFYLNLFYPTLRYHLRQLQTSITHTFTVEEYFEEVSQKRAAQVDGNHLLYLARACQLFRVGHGNSLEQGLLDIKAKVLFLPAKFDLLLPAFLSKNMYDILKSQGKEVYYEEIVGLSGHLDAFFNIGQKAATIKKFLEK